jgi:hypothetical protein
MQRLRIAVFILLAAIGNAQRVPGRQPDAIIVGEAINQAPPSVVTLRVDRVLKGVLQEGGPYGRALMRPAPLRRQGGAERWSETTEYGRWVSMLVNGR